MKTDLITIFNRLTSIESADCDFFNDILDFHYEKVKYLNSLLNGVNKSEINDIICKSYDSYNIHIIISVTNISYITTLLNKIEINKNKYYYSKYLDIEVFNDDEKIHLYINAIDERGEEEFYENRLI